ncbi:hypothetical protein [Aquabacterium soli]|nr:hypothetical protein [Aquabacterium soli]
MATMVATVVVVGCASVPQGPVDIKPATLSGNSTRIGVAMTAVPKVDTSFPGAGCLLCLAAASMMNNSLTDHIRTLPPEGLDTLKQEIAQAITKKGATAVVIAEQINVDDLPRSSGSAPNTAPRDHSSFKQKYQIDKLLVINVSYVGVERAYSAYVPTTDPKGALRGTGYLLDLSSNTYEWYLPVAVIKGAEGNWDEPPKFPGVTNAYFQALEQGKETFLTPFK